MLAILGIVANRPLPRQAGMELAEPKLKPAGPYHGYLNELCVTLAEVLKRAGNASLASIG